MAQDNRGGRREGAGRKPQTADQKAVAKFEKALKRAKKRYGDGVEAWEDRLAAMCYSRKEHIAFPALKLAAELLIGKHSRVEAEVTKKEEGPVILPELNDEPEREEKDELLN